jgi:CRP/FNR family transcriptional regulator, anaerobic regulatory protein
VFSEEDITTSFYNLLEGVMRLYKLLPPTAGVEALAAA